MAEKTRFALSRRSESAWERKGLRSFLEYRELGLAGATDGRFGAHVARALQAGKPGSGAPRHYHTMGFHFIYVLKGWLRTEFEGLGEVVMREGDSLAYEGQVPQEHIEYSEDFEVLQITMPAEFETVELAPRDR